MIFRRFATNRLKGFSLENSFRLRSMEISISVVFPFSLMHTLTFCVQFIAFVYSVKYWNLISSKDEAMMNEFVNFVSILWDFRENTSTYSSIPVSVRTKFTFNLFAIMNGSFV